MGKSDNGINFRRAKGNRLDGPLHVGVIDKNHLGFTHVELMN